MPILAHSRRWVAVVHPEIGVALVRGRDSFEQGFNWHRQASVSFGETIRLAGKLIPLYGETVRKAIVKQESHRQRILDVASDVFLECGFEQTSTAEIARRAKVSKRELYFSFAGKRALLAAVITELQDSMRSTMDLRWSSNEPMETILRESAAAIHNFILSERFGKLVRMVAAESYRDPAVAKQFFELGPLAGRKATAKFLKAQMEKGKLRKADPTRAADHFLDLVVGAQRMTAIVLGQVDPAARKRDHIHQSVEVFLRIYATARKKPRRRPKL